MNEINAIDNEQIIFQVKINRDTQDFEFVKLKLSSFEQASFELFMMTYVKSIFKERVDDFYIEDLEDKEDEK